MCTGYYLQYIVNPYVGCNITTVYEIYSLHGVCVHVSVYDLLEVTTIN